MECLGAVLSSFPTCLSSNVLILFSLSFSFPWYSFLMFHRKRVIPASSRLFHTWPLVCSTIPFPYFSLCFIGSPSSRKLSKGSRATYDLPLHHCLLRLFTEKVIKDSGQRDCVIRRAPETRILCVYLMAPAASGHTKISTNVPGRARNGEIESAGLKVYKLANAT